MRYKTFFGIGLMAALVITIFFTATISKKSGAQNGAQQRTSIKIPVRIKQLAAEKSVIPIELKCEDAELSAPNEFDKLNCTAKNNTEKDITALVLAYTFSIEENGKAASTGGAINIIALLHPDFYEQFKDTFIHPKEESPLNILPTTLDDNTVIKEMTIQLEYAEFDNGSVIGENSNGKETIRQIRQGVAIYKDWFAKKYNENGRTEQAFTELFQTRQTSKENLGDLTVNQLEGARVMQKFIRRIYLAKGIQGVNDIFKK